MTPIKIIRDVPYSQSDGQTLLLDLAFPDPLPPHPMPVVLNFPGGAWMECQKGVEYASILPQHGFFYASINYRVSSQAIFPAQIHDCKAAVRWLRSNAATYRVDPDRIGVWGGSAGGHLAALLGTSAEIAELEGQGGYAGFSSRVQAVLDMSGPTDLLDPTWLEVYEPASPPERLLGGPVLERADLARQASPLSYINGQEPPFLLIHGDQDQIVPIRQSQLLYEALQKAGSDVTFRPIRGGGHNFDREWPEVEAMMLAFFQQHLKG